MRIYSWYQGEIHGLEVVETSAFVTLNLTALEDSGGAFQHCVYFRKDQCALTEKEALEKSASKLLTESACINQRKYAIEEELVEINKLLEA